MDESQEEEATSKQFALPPKKRRQWWALRMTKNDRQQSGYYTRETRHVSRRKPAILECRSCRPKCRESSDTDSSTTDDGCSVNTWPTLTKRRIPTGRSGSSRDAYHPSNERIPATLERRGKISLVSPLMLMVPYRKYTKEANQSLVKQHRNRMRRRDMLSRPDGDVSFPTPSKSDVPSSEGEFTEGVEGDTEVSIQSSFKTAIELPEEEARPANSAQEEHIYMPTHSSRSAWYQKQPQVYPCGIWASVRQRASSRGYEVETNSLPSGELNTVSMHPEVPIAQVNERTPGRDKATLPESEISMEGRRLAAPTEAGSERTIQQQASSKTSGDVMIERPKSSNFEVRQDLNESKNGIGIQEQQSVPVKAESSSREDKAFVPGPEVFEILVNAFISSLSVLYPGR